MRTIMHVTLFLFSACAVKAQTARDYFKELKAANEFTRYKDEYACFRDDDVPSFIVVARGSSIIEHMKKAGRTPGKELMEAKDALFVQSYSKGVAISKGDLYMPVPATDSEYEIVFNKPLHGRVVYSINWLTGRYRYQLYDLNQSKIVPAYDGSGKCELIHPDVP